jgi:DNA-binding transcriptional LysR family regulator
LAVVDHQGFHRAAEHLFIAQPSLSQSIAGLERELGVLLFHRVGRGVILSEAGKQLIGPARQVMRDLEAARSTIDAIKGISTGRIDLITMPSPGIEPLSTIMQRFSSAHPNVTMNVDAAFVPDEVIEAVRTGASEIGLVGTPAAARVPDLTVIPLELQELVLVTAPGGPFTGRDTITPADLAGHRLIASQRGSLMRQLVDDVLSTGIEAHLVAEVAHRTSILPLVLAGVGDAVLPDGWNRLAKQAGAMTFRIEPTSFLRIAAVTRQHPLSPPAAAFIDVTTRYAAERRRAADHSGANK